MKKKGKTIYILLTDTGTFLNRVIKWFTQAPYNHASIAFDEQLEEIYSFGRKQPRNPLIAGFVKEDVYSGTYRYFQNTRCLILKIEVSEMEYERIRQIIDYFKQNKDQFSYNLIGLLGVLFHYPISKKNSYFCSQFVAEVFKRSRIHLWERPTGLITPNDFLLHHAFEIMYEGRLYDYPHLNRKRLHEAEEDNPIIMYAANLLKKLLLLNE
ncbi:hypothetical protein [Fervidibacillus halotolerans]|uniref:Permuted papain-like amidase enzyme, YaeF/YiiX, C92 family n=1 Tax=Fervidibacillus halotolerans TaxID=2980027 RepID=A0A9E8M056_9BACI|nr:hypothetical protein [Fervidibacillus halotolerans]WAA12500.1 hypothetical protein OE105_13415 [Fervidibacillus halotolerans]